MLIIHFTGESPLRDTSLSRMEREKKKKKKKSFIYIYKRERDLITRFHHGTDIGAQI